MDDLTGRLLVATPVIGDPNFDRTVVLMLEHGDEGSLGLVLNRPSDVDVADPLPQWRHLAAAPGVVFVGGPVEQTTAIGLARVAFPVDRDSASDRSVHTSTDPFDGDEASGFSALTATIGTLDLSLSPDEVSSPIEQVRVFAGYAGWGAGQLDSELAAEAWVVVDGEPGDVVDGDPAGLWARVLRRQGGDLALLASYPPDPSLN